ncbi:MAG: hypothetical protein RMJ66_06735 [Bacteroidia bacterium]|nr:hypothetical protein [Bacteroidia bacterium]MDW8134748.1 hypothetical protein [Bacteroidia bacterium]
MRISSKVKQMAVIASVLVIWISCRGKEGPQGPAGPQGPPGRDLVRPQQGRVQGIAFGKDNNGNAFNIPFSYSFLSDGNPGIWRSVDANTKEFSFLRTDSLSIGYIDLTFRYNASNNTVSNVSIEGLAANIAGTPAATYTIQQIPSIPGIFQGTVQDVSNVSVNGDSVSGSILYVRPAYNIPNLGSNVHPDTVRATFSVRLIPTVSYGRRSGR